MNYEIKGGTLPVVICTVTSGERLVTEGGGMSWMTPNFKMETSAGGFSKAFGRILSGESAFQNFYTCTNGTGLIAFASSFPGTIKVFNISPTEEIILQKRAFLASEASVTSSTHFSKKFGAGLFGGEGFIMQRLSGNGVAFAEFDGHVEEYELNAGQQIIVDTGHLAAMSVTCNLDVVSVPGIKNALFGGEGIFNTVITGPGRVWLQSMNIGNLASLIAPYVSTK